MESNNPKPSSSTNGKSNGFMLNTGFQSKLSKVRQIVTTFKTKLFQFGRLDKDDLQKFLNNQEQRKNTVVKFLKPIAEHLPDADLKIQELAQSFKEEEEENNLSANFLPESLITQLSVKEKDNQNSEKIDVLNKTRIPRELSQQNPFSDEEQTKKTKPIGAEMKEKKRTEFMKHALYNTQQTTPTESEDLSAKNNIDIDRQWEETVAKYKSQGAKPKHLSIENYLAFNRKPSESESGISTLAKNTSADNPDNSTEKSESESGVSISATNTSEDNPDNSTEKSENELFKSRLSRAVRKRKLRRIAADFLALKSQRLQPTDTDSDSILFNYSTGSEDNNSIYLTSTSGAEDITTTDTDNPKLQDFITFWHSPNQPHNFHDMKTRLCNPGLSMNFLENLSNELKEILNDQPINFDSWETKHKKPQSYADNEAKRQQGFDREYLNKDKFLSSDSSDGGTTSEDARLQTFIKYCNSLNEIKKNYILTTRDTESSLSTPRSSVDFPTNPLTTGLLDSILQNLKEAENGTTYSNSFGNNNKTINDLQPVPQQIKAENQTFNKAKHTLSNNNYLISPPTILLTTNPMFSTFWFLSGESYVVLDINPVDPAILHSLYDVFRQICTYNQDLHLGIDDKELLACGSSRDTYKKSNYLPHFNGASYIWLSTGDFVIPFGGQILTHSKRQIIFNYILEGVKETDSLHFGVDDVIFSNVPIFCCCGPIIFYEDSQSSGCMPKDIKIGNEQSRLQDQTNFMQNSYPFKNVDESDDDLTFFSLDGSNVTHDSQDILNTENETIDQLFAANELQETQQKNIIPTTKDFQSLNVNLAGFPRTVEILQQQQQQQNEDLNMLHIENELFNQLFADNEIQEAQQQNEIATTNGAMYPDESISKDIEPLNIIPAGFAATVEILQQQQQNEDHELLKEETQCLRTTNRNPLFAANEIQEIEQQNEIATTIGAMYPDEPITKDFKTLNIIPAGFAATVESLQQQQQNENVELSKEENQCQETTTAIPRSYDFLNTRFF